MLKYRKLNTTITFHLYLRDNNCILQNEENTSFKKASRLSTELKRCKSPFYFLIKKSYIKLKSQPYDTHISPI